MLLLKSFLFCGIVCMIAQIILDNTKLSPGHITSIFVVFGAFLDSFSFYDKIIKSVGGGALLPITSFGHSLIHGALAKANEYGIIGILIFFGYLLCSIIALFLKIQYKLLNSKLKISSN